MAKPLVLFENIYETTGATVTETSEATGFPTENMFDWRTATAYRWKSNSTTVIQSFNVDLGSGNTASPDTVAFAGHNLSTVGATYQVDHSDDGAAWTNLFSAATPSSDLPQLKKFTASAHRYWRFRVLNPTWSAAPQIGVLVLGRRLDFTEPAQPDLDPYGVEAVVEDAANENGSWIGTNVRYLRKRFSLNYDTPGFTKTDFFAPASGLGFDADFIPHAVTGGKPFFFAWNTDVDADEIYLCKVDNYSVRMPFVGSTARRSLFCTFEARREIS